MFLYKYSLPERIDVLERRRILFSPPDKLNDPFELMADLSFITTPEYREKIRREAEMNLQIKGALRAAKEGKRSVWRARTFEALFEQMFDKRLPSMSQEVTAVAASARDFVRVLCFSKVHPCNPEAILLWSHYTNGSRGFVLEFDSEHPWFKAHSADPKGDAGDVIYDDQRTEMYTDGVLRGKASGILFRKSRYWKYEQEFRLIRAKGHPQLDATEKDSFAALPPTVIRSIFLGVNSGADLASRVLGLAAHRDYAHVRVLQTSLQIDAFCFDARCVRESASA